MGALRPRSALLYNTVPFIDIAMTVSMCISPSQYYMLCVKWAALVCFSAVPFIDIALTGVRASPSQPAVLL